MRIMIISGSPNKEGLTAACAEQARLGVIESGAEIMDVRLNNLSIGMCHACEINGWGTCFNRHTCQVEDDFQRYYDSMKEADGLIILTPVYWGDMSESTKAFLDRVRRCEGFKRENHYLKGKPVITVAIAGGTGYGCISCLANMEKFIGHIKAFNYDTFAITRRNRKYKLRAIFEAVIAMTGSIKKANQEFIPTQTL